MVRLEGGHEEGQEGGVVVNSDATVDHQERSGPAGVDRLGREVPGRGRARPYELPQREIEVALEPVPTTVVLGAGVVGQRPRRVGRGIAHDDQQQRSQLVRPERGVLAEDLLEPGRELLVLELRTEAPPEARLVEHRSAALEVELADFGHAHPQRQAGCDDRARAGPGDEVELVREPKILTAGAAQLSLDLSEDLDRDQPTDPAAIEREQLAWAATCQDFID